MDKKKKEKKLYTYWGWLRKNLGPALKTSTQDAEHLAYKTLDLFTQLISFLVGSALFGALTFKIMASGGLAGVIAQLMATTCTNNSGIACEYNTLLGGAGLALVIVTSWSIFFTRVLVIADNEILDGPNPSKVYNDDMSALLADILRLGGVENLKALADWKGMPYSTVYRYINIFKKDGYVTVHSSGKGNPVIVEVSQ